MNKIDLLELMKKADYIATKAKFLFQMADEMLGESKALHYESMSLERDLDIIFKESCDKKEAGDE